MSTEIGRSPMVMERATDVPDDPIQGRAWRIRKPGERDFEAAKIRISHEIGTLKCASIDVCMDDHGWASVSMKFNVRGDDPIKGMCAIVASRFQPLIAGKKCLSLPLDEGAFYIDRTTGEIEE